MRYILFIFSSCCMISCSDSFINHSLKAEKGGPCTGVPGPVKIISNINGERFEFDYCLDENFSNKDYTVSRKGDTVIVSFPGTRGKNALYKLTLDIDAKPAYHHILLGDRVMEVSPVHW